MCGVVELPEPGLLSAACTRPLCSLTAGNLHRHVPLLDPQLPGVDVVFDRRRLGLQYEHAAERAAVVGTFDHHDRSIHAVSARMLRVAT